MTAHKVSFHADGQAISRDIQGNTPEEALALTRKLWDPEPRKTPVRFIDLGYAVAALKPVPPIRVAGRLRKSYAVVALCERARRKGGAV
jgi:hypothetical protein